MKYIPTLPVVSANWFTLKSGKSDSTKPILQQIVVMYNFIPTTYNNSVSQLLLPTYNLHSATGLPNKLVY